MIEITHQQAQRMIREKQDRRLPDEQWAILEAHLESCPTCRAYQERLVAYQRILVRTLRARWGGIRGPRGGIAQKALETIERQKARRHRFVQAIPWLLGVLALFLWILYRNLTAPAPSLPSTPTLLPGSAPTITPTAILTNVHFQGGIAFESHKDGNAEIYLVSITPNGPELTNLTQNAADDTAPAWSPDGEWLAFLSDRSGKNEVYVMHVAGSRLTQLTSETQIEWQGPLSWSGDGQYIGLRGRRIERSDMTDALAYQNYLVPLNGSQPQSLAQTYGAQTMMRFSPSQKGYAFSSSRPQKSLIVGNYATGWTGEVTLEDRQTMDVSPVMTGAFDWSLGGRNLVYVVKSPLSATFQSQIRFSQDLEVGDHTDFTGGSSQTIDQIAYPGTFKALSWMPHSLVVASLAGQAADDCFVVRLKNAYIGEESARVLSGLCVEGGLAANNWSSDGEWLVLLGRKTGENRPGLYALRLPALDAHEALTGSSNPFELLVDLSVEPVGKTGPNWAEPQVRPVGGMLNISPQATTVQRVSPVVGEFELPASLAKSWIVFSVMDGQNTQIARMHPDGTERQTLTTGPVEHTCPRISPDGKTIGYLSAEEGLGEGWNDVYRMDIDGTHVVRLTTGFIFSRQAPSSLHYDCPVWSPDGEWLAFVLRLDNGNYLAIIPSDGKSGVRYIKVEPVSTLSPLVWVPDSPRTKLARQILLVYPQGERPTRLMAVNLKAAKVLQPEFPDTNIEDMTLADPTIVVEKLQLFGWHDVEGLTLSPDGTQWVGIVEYMANLLGAHNASNSIAQLRIYTLDDLKLMAATPLSQFNAQNAGLGSLFWLPEYWPITARVIARIGPEKTVFECFTPSDNNVEVMGYFEDILTRPAVSRDNLAVFVAESGLWLIDLSKAQINPRLLSGNVISDVDWR